MDTVAPSNRGGTSLDVTKLWKNTDLEAEQTTKRKVWMLTSGSGLWLFYFLSNLSWANTPKPKQSGSAALLPRAL